MDQVSRIGRSLVEWGLFAYLLELAFARGMEAWIRDLPLLMVSAGLIFGLVSDWRTGETGPPFELKLPVLIFFASFAIAMGFSEFPKASLYRASYLPVGFLVFFAVQYAFIDRDSFRRLSLCLTSLVILIGIDGITQLLTGESLFGSWESYADTERIRAGLPHPNDLAVLAVLVPIALMPLSGSPSRWTRTAVIAAIPLVLITAITSQSRNALIGLTCSVGVLLILSRLRKQVLWVAAGAAILVTLALTFDLGNLQARIASLGNVQQDGRIGIWYVAAEMFKEHPFSGIGPYLFADFYLETLANTTLPAGYQPERTYIPWAHNLYLEALAERGIVGLLGFAVFCIAALHRVIRSLFQPQTNTERDYAVALAASWSALLVMGLFDLTFLKDWVLLVFMLLAGLSARLVVLDDAEPVSEAPERANPPKPQQPM